MSRDCIFLVPGDWEGRTGGYLYDRRIVDGLRAAGWRVTRRSPGDGFPLPDATAREQARGVIDALPDGALVVADGLGFSALPELVEQHAQRLRWLALVHHPLAFESGLSPDEQARLFDSERRALACARQVVVTSASTARALAGFDVPTGRITVIEPGTDRAPQATGGGAGAGALSLLCVATVTARKGHTVLLDALAGLQGRAWHLHCAGSLARDDATVAAVRAGVAGHGLAGRVTWHGEVDGPALEALYAQADLFVLPSFHEGYGMALAEALAHGLPIVSSAAGAIPDTVPARAGVLVPPGDPEALRGALQRLMDDVAWRASLAAGAREAAERLPTWDDASARFAAVLDAVAA
ncbi:glycosyltransferase family 4 protein [Variovorax sp. LT1P1]|uniref:glycosyltransferase family 4 protein n=1 Tax=Variovorax sp. LT1P1 TaxID=3443730 RepID=UPI003F45E314